MSKNQVLLNAMIICVLHSHANAVNVIPDAAVNFRVWDPDDAYEIVSPFVFRKILACIENIFWDNKGNTSLLFPQICDGCGSACLSSCVHFNAACARVMRMVSHSNLGAYDWHWALRLQCHIDLVSVGSGFAAKVQRVPGKIDVVALHVVCLFFCGCCFQKSSIAGYPIKQAL